MAGDGVSFLLSAGEEDGGIESKIKVLRGTTILAFKFQHSAIVASYGRVTENSKNVSETKNKVIELSPCLLGAMARIMADCEHYLDLLEYDCQLYRLHNNRYISVPGASKLLAKMVDNNKGMGLEVSCVAGTGQA